MSKFFILYSRYVNGLIIRILFLFFLEKFKGIFTNAKNEIQNQRLNSAAEGLFSFENPYDDNSFRESPILIFLRIPNIVLGKEIMKFCMIFLDLLCSILIEILLNLQQRKFLRKKKNEENPLKQEDKKFFSILLKVINFLKNFYCFRKSNFQGALYENEIKYNSFNLFYFDGRKEVSNYDDCKKCEECLISKINFNCLGKIVKESLLTNKNLIIEQDKNNSNVNESNNKSEKNNCLIKIKFFLISIFENSFSYYSFLYIYNPLLIISLLQGSYDPIFFNLIFTILITIELNLYAAAGVLYGISIHFEFLPLMFFPAILLYILFKTKIEEANSASESKNKSKERNFYKRFFPNFTNNLFFEILFVIFDFIYQIISSILFLFKLVFSLRSIKFIFFTMFSYGLIFLFFYVLFTEKFIHRYLLNQLYSRDLSINLSLYNYLNCFIKRIYMKKLFGLFIYLPQIVLIIISNIYLYRDINLSLLVTTWIYLSFNKEISLRYFSWIFILLILNIPFIYRIKEKFKTYSYLILIYCFIYSIWYYNLILFEFYGVNNFLNFWILNCSIFILNSILIKKICEERYLLIYPYNCSDRREKDYLRKKKRINN